MDIASFFSGCGGLDLGFEQAGFRVVWANDSNPDVRATYMQNHRGTTFVPGDIRKIRVEDIPACDGFIGGPPCQSWSVAGKQRGLEDARGQMFLVYINLIKVKKPKFFLIENVKGLLSERFKDVFEKFVSRLDTIGYDVNWKLLDAANYDVPQNRERVFIIGFRKDLSIQFDFPQPTTLQAITLRKAIGDIKEPPRGFRSEKITTPNCTRANHDIYTGSFNPYYYYANRRRGWERPSFTIHATGENAPLHPSSPPMAYLGPEKWTFQPGREHEYRRLSVRECARIQTFPDNFVFDCPNILALYKMIGNAVPPRLARALGKAVLASFINKGETEEKQERSLSRAFLQATVLIGYYKSDKQHKLIMRNHIYYVRADRRKGSLQIKDFKVAPKYLLLHNKDNSELYELQPSCPILADASFLKSLGFECAGNSYLCFALKNAEKKNLCNFGGSKVRLECNERHFSPYISTIEQIIKKEDER